MIEDILVELLGFGVYLGVLIMEAGYLLAVLPDCTSLAWRGWDIQPEIVVMTQ